MVMARISEEGKKAVEGEVRRAEDGLRRARALSTAYDCAERIQDVVDEAERARRRDDLREAHAILAADATRELAHGLENLIGGNMGTLWLEPRAILDQYRALSSKAERHGWNRRR